MFELLCGINKSLNTIGNLKLSGFLKEKSIPVRLTILVYKTELARFGTLRICDMNSIGVLKCLWQDMCHT